jgi:hypothetical protein
MKCKFLLLISLFLIISTVRGGENLLTNNSAIQKINRTKDKLDEREIKLRATKEWQKSQKKEIQLEKCSKHCRDLKEEGKYNHDTTVRVEYVTLMEDLMTMNRTLCEIPEWKEYNNTHVKFLNLLDKHGYIDLQ